MSECTHDCESCSQDCASRTAPESLIESLNENSTVRRVIAVVSGKGGVGKSSVTAMLASMAQRRGHSAAILDADITGPSIPKVFGIHERAKGDGQVIFPAVSLTGIQLMSVNLLLENPTDPVVWRGPIIAGTVKQFWSDVLWSDVDYMFVDMPPGTGDVPLTVFQSIPVDGIVVVTSPQELVGMIVEKAANMAKMMNVPVLGLIENYSYLECPHCGERISVFGESHIDQTAQTTGLPVLAKLPLDSRLAALCDEGHVERYEAEALSGALDRIEKELPVG